MTRTRLAELYEQALDLPPDQRAPFLDTACGDDRALRRELEAMLAVDDSPAARAFDALLPAPSARWPDGTVIAGRYRIVRQLGEGGMGIVYEAEQQEPRRRVALKCLRPGLHDGSSLQRFQREVDLLARLQHPGIATVFDAGIADGPHPQPFFVMEFVDGPPLCDHLRGLPLASQLEGFAEVCDAVQHAHSRGIVHRDLKPSNLLVGLGGARPQPKVLDFGIARAVAAIEGDALTGTHEIIGTLAYLSPEQLTGGSAAVTARADVWSLGVTLYQLLAGNLPFEVHGLPLPVAAQRLLHDEPAPLARRVPMLRGDIATIVHKALAKEPERRYPDAGALAADLRRHLQHEPITARPRSAIYRANRFAKRHRGLVAGAATAFVALGLGLALSLLATAREAEQRRAAEGLARDLRLLVRDVVFDVESELAAVPAATAARRTLVTAGLRYTAKLEELAATDRGLLYEVAAAHHRLAQVQGMPGRSNLGETAAAETSLQRCLDLLQRAVAQAPAAAAIVELRILATADLAELRRVRRDLAGSAALLRGQDADFEALAALGAAARAQRLRATNRARLGRLQMESGDHAGARATWTTFRDELRARPTPDAATLSSLAVTEQFLGDLHLEANETTQALAAFRAGTASAEAALALEPTAPNARTELVGLLQSQARATQTVEGGPAALPLLERARALLDDPAWADPNDVRQLRTLAGIEFAIADLHLLANTPELAQPFARRYQERIAELRRRAPQYPTLLRDEGLAQQLLGRTAGALGDEAGTEAAFAAAITIARAALAQTKHGPAETTELLRIYGGLAAARNTIANRQQDDRERARLYLAAADALAEKLALLGTLREQQTLTKRLQADLDRLPGEIAQLRSAAAALPR